MRDFEGAEVTYYGEEFVAKECEVVLASLNPRLTFRAAASRTVSILFAGLHANPDEAVGKLARAAARCGIGKQEIEDTFNEWIAIASRLKRMKERYIHV